MDEVVLIDPSEIRNRNLKRPSKIYGMGLNVPLPAVLVPSLPRVVMGVSRPDPLEAQGRFPFHPLVIAVAFRLWSPIALALM